VAVVSTVDPGNLIDLTGSSSHSWISTIGMTLPSGAAFNWKWADEKATIASAGIRLPNRSRTRGL
jgi:hypothetical protein